MNTQGHTNPKPFNTIVQNCLKPAALNMRGACAAGMPLRV